MSLMEALKKYLTEEKWNFREEEEGAVILLTVRCKNGVYEGFFVNRKPTRIDFYFKVPLSIPVEKATEICEYLTRVNYGLTMITFEFSFERGEVRSRTSLVWGEESSPSAETIKHHLIGNYLCLDRYFEGITAILYGGLSAKEALDKAENDIRPQTPTQLQH